MIEVLTANQEILQAYWEKSFNGQTQPQDYIVERGLFAEYSNGRMIDSEGGYNHILKGPGRQTLVESIEKKIKQLGTIDLLDIGCGAGRFLIDCASTYPGVVRGQGLTACRYSWIFTTEPCETTEEAIKRLCIEVKVGDAQRLTSIYDQQQFDIITAVRVACYLADPWALVKGVHEILKLGGIAYIDRILPVLQYNRQAVAGMSEEEISALYDYLERDERFEIKNLANLVYCKYDPELNLPIATLGSNESTFSDGIQYRFIAA